MEGLYWFIIQLAALLSLTQTSLAVKCYVCNSKSNDKCKNPVKNGLELIDCNGDEAQKAHISKGIKEVTEMMVKLGLVKEPQANEKNPEQIWENKSYPMACQKMEIEVLGETVIGRGCSAVKIERYDPCKSLEIIDSRKGFKLNYCGLCESDGCNAGVQNQSLFIGVIALVIAAVLAT